MKATEEVLSKDNYAEREAAENLRQSAALKSSTGPQRTEVLRDLDVKLSLRAAADSSAELATSHMIEALAPLLPSNPRQIKRSLMPYRLCRKQRDYRMWLVPARPNGKYWRDGLLLWRVAKVIYTLSRYPGLADKALELEGRNDLPERNADKFIEAIKANKHVMELLVFADPSKGWHRRDIGGNEISWLRF